MRFINGIGFALATAAVGLSSLGARPAAAVPALRLTPDANNVGNNGFGYSLGYEFTTNAAITVDALGYFTETGTFAEDHPLALYTSTGTPLAGSDVGTGSITFTQGDFAYHTIAPLTLAAGGDYIVTGASGTADPYADNPTAFSTAPSINFVEDRYSNTGGATAAFPALTDGVNVGYFGASFDIGGAPPVPEPSAVAPFAFAALGLGVLLRRARKRKAE